MRAISIEGKRIINNWRRDRFTWNPSSFSFHGGFIMVDYLIYVRLVIGIGLLLAGGVSVFLDHSPSQIVFSTLAIVIGILFTILGLRPEKQKESFKGSKDINFKLEEKEGDQNGV
jgi:hypothetical protein